MHEVFLLSKLKNIILYSFIRSVGNKITSRIDGALVKNIVK